MNTIELLEFRTQIAARRAMIIAQLANVPVAQSEAESLDQPSDALAEGLFLRAFIAYEANLDTLFFHYVTGGLSVQGRAAISYLAPGNEQVARKMVKAGFRFLSWTKPEIIRDTAKTYIENGWPIADMMSANGHELADCERIRNKIAHNSLESSSEFSIVQRNLLGTERVFRLTPGQLLRIRRRSASELHLTRLISVMHDTIEAIVDPPP